MKLPSAPPKQSRFLRSQQDLKAKFEQQSAEGGGGGECDGGFCCFHHKTFITFIYLRYPVGACDHMTCSSDLPYLTLGVMVIQAVLNPQVDLF